MEAFRQLQQHSLPLALDFLRLFIWLLLLTAIFVPLEKIFALHAQKVFRKAFLPDLAYYFLNGFSTKLLLVLPMTAVVWALHFLLPSGLAAGWRLCRWVCAFRHPWSWRNSGSIGGIAGPTKFRFSGAFMQFITVRRKWIGW